MLNANILASVGLGGHYARRTMNGGWRTTNGERRTVNACFPVQQGGRWIKRGSWRGPKQKMRVRPGVRIAIRRVYNRADAVGL